MILAAGLGTRLQPITNDIPKALVKIGGRTLLEHTILYLKKYGITDIIVNVHHFADSIEQIIVANNGFGSHISISDERSEVLETGGGLKKGAHFFDGEHEFVLMNVDIITNLDLSKLIQAQRTSEAIGTLAVMKRNSSRQLLFDDNMCLCGWQNNKTGEERITKNGNNMKQFAFSGIQVLANKVLQNIPFDGKFSLIDLYLYLAKDNTILGYDHTGDTLIDVGKPEAIQEATSFLEHS